jgi:histidine triad (HIT) family protein
MSAECIFCQILRGEAPASFVYRDERSAAFMDIRPVNAGHVLVIPNEHAADLAALDLEAGTHVFRVAQRVAAAVRRSGVRCEGVNLVLADGEVAGQEVFHVHLHVVPRFRRDGFGFKFAPGYFEKKTSRVDLDRVAEAIRGQL